MPGINGRKLAETLLKDRPSLKVMYMSGYTDDKLSDHGLVGPSVRLLQKPLRPESLAVAVRTALDER
jgi:FixJ family two-component response regulator